MDATNRFTALAGLYARCRPDYPAECIDFIVNACALGPATLLVDVGCGTGISSRLFAQESCSVTKRPFIWPVAATACKQKRRTQPQESAIMAVVRIESYNGEGDDLPDVCICCGADATLHKKKQFSWYPPWIGITLLAGGLIFIILALVMTKKCRLNVPLCDRHSWHWVWPPLILLSSLVALIALGIPAGIMLDDKTNGTSDVGGVLCGAALIGLVGWLIMAVIVANRTVKPDEITDEHIKLKNVSPEFADAYEEMAGRRRPRLDRSASERFGGGRSRRSRDDEDEEDDRDRRGAYRR